MLKWSAIPFSGGPRLVRAPHHDPSAFSGSQGCDPCDHFGSLSVTVVSVLEALGLYFLLFLSVLW